MLSQLNAFETLGVLGAVLYVLNYLRVVMNGSAADRVGYFVLNLTAASLVLVSLSQAFNLAAALIQIFFVGMSIIGIARRLQKLRRPHQASRLAWGSGVLRVLHQWRRRRLRAIGPNFQCECRARCARARNNDEVADRGLDLI